MAAVMSTSESLRSESCIVMVLSSTSCRATDAFRDRAWFSLRSSFSTLASRAATQLRSLPRANCWSLAAEHSFSRPAFSQAVQAGNLPSHWLRGQSGEAVTWGYMKELGGGATHLDFSYPTCCYTRGWSQQRCSGSAWKEASHILNRQTRAETREGEGCGRSWTGYALCGVLLKGVELRVNSLAVVRPPRRCG